MRNSAFHLFFFFVAATFQLNIKKKYFAFAQNCCFLGLLDHTTVHIIVCFVYCNPTLLSCCKTKYEVCSKSHYVLSPPTRDNRIPRSLNFSHFYFFLCFKNYCIKRELNQTQKIKPLSCSKHLKWAFFFGLSAVCSEVRMKGFKHWFARLCVQVIFCYPDPIVPDLLFLLWHFKESGTTSSCYNSFLQPRPSTPGSLFLSQSAHIFIPFPFTCCSVWLNHCAAFFPPTPPKYTF